MLLKLLLALAMLALSAQAFSPLSDGNSLSGWHAIGKGEWKVEAGSIAGRHSREDLEFGHLVTDAVYGDFILRLQFKIVSGNSGLCFRLDESGFSGVSGFQAEIDPFQDTGGLYETNGRAWLVKPSAGQVQQGGWNEMTVSAQGTKIIVTVNGTVTAEIDDQKGRRQGRIGLQLHGGQECLIYFKELEIQGEPVTQ